MKALHLSDLHLGKRLLDFSLIEDQIYILEQVKRLIRREKVDTVFLAGDIFDKTVPSEEAVGLLSDFLTSLTEANTSVYIISGNHDSGERLNFGEKLLQKSKIYVASLYREQPYKFKHSDQYGTVNIYLLPFIKPSYVRRLADGDDKEGIITYNDAVRFAVEQMRIDREQRNVVVAHQFVTGAFTCDSEEHILGGLDSVDAKIFEPFDYAALGHIHSPQNISGKKIRYCGTLLKYSVSEASQRKSATIVNFGPKGQVDVEEHQLQPLRDLRKIKGSFAELTLRENYRETAQDDYIYAELTDNVEVLNAGNVLRKIYPRLLSMGYVKDGSGSFAASENFRNISESAPLELFQEFYSRQHGGTVMDEEEIRLVQELLDRAGGDDL